MTDTISFGQWLKQRRKALDLTREELAVRVGCAANTIYKIEADERRPSKQIAELLTEPLNIPSEDHDVFILFARGEVSEVAAPWVTPFHPKHNLHSPPTILIGREADIASVRKRLLQPETRMLTLIGPPGIGKTRLALQTANEVLDKFEDGVYFVALAPIEDANRVLKTIVTTLELQEIGPQTTLERLTAFLRDRRTLLILDNFEQILPAAPQIAQLLGLCPFLKVLVTSRAPLRIRQERQLPVAPLALPDLSDLPNCKVISQYAAITLFLERAQAVKPDFSLTDENAQAVAAICTRLDGLPLAIELISARIKLLPPSALLERLHGRVMLQSDGLRDIEPRHRTLNAAIDWSYQQLSPDEQKFFWRLGMFVGGWTLESAKAICTVNLSLNILDGLASLLDKNLVKQDIAPDGEPRFMMLETILEYARERLAQSGEISELHQLHLNYFLKLAEDAESFLSKPQQNLWLDRLEAEWDNLRAALNWSQSTETGLRLAGILGWYFNLHSHWREGIDHLKRALAANSHAPDFLRAKALNRSASLEWVVGSGDQAKLSANEALTIARTNDDAWNMAWALLCLGFMGSEDPHMPATLLEESLRIFRELDDPLGLSIALYRRTYRAIDLKDYHYARTLLKEMSIHAREANDKFMAACTSIMTGRVVWAQDNNLIQARDYYEQARTLFREATSPEDANMTVSMLAEIELALGNYERSERLNKEALILDREIALDHPRIVFMLAGLATVAKVRGQFERAARLLGAANSKWLILFSTLHPYIVPYERDISEVKTALGDDTFNKAWAEGKAMSIDERVAYAFQ